MNPTLFAFLLLCGLIYFVRTYGESFFSLFLENGSLLAVLLMTYTSSVVYDIIKVNKNEALAAKAPAAFKSTFAALFIFIAIPCIIWPPIYIATYDGWLAGLFAYALLQTFAFCLSRLLDFKSATTGFHLILAVIACFVGYYLSYMDYTGQSITAQLLPYKTMALEQLMLLKDWLFETAVNLKDWISQQI